MKYGFVEKKMLSLNPTLNLFVVLLILQKVIMNSRLNGRTTNFFQHLKAGRSNLGHNSDNFAFLHLHLVFQKIIKIFL